MFLKIYRNAIVACTTFFFVGCTSVATISGDFALENRCKRISAKAYTQCLMEHATQTSYVERYMALAQPELLQNREINNCPHREDDLKRYQQTVFTMCVSYGY